MKDRLIIGTLAGVVFLAALGVAIVHGDVWPAAPVQRPAAHTPLLPAAVPLQALSAVRPMAPMPTPDPATPPQPAAPEPTAGDPASDGRAAPARDRAAAHSARSR